MINEAMWDAAIDEAATAAAGAKPRRANGNTQNAHTMPVYEPSGTERNGYDADRFKWETADTTKGPVLNSLWLVKGVLPRHGTGALAEYVTGLRYSVTGFRPLTREMDDISLTLTNVRFDAT